MMYEQSEIPLANADLASHGQAAPGLLTAGPHAPRTSLESERFGLFPAPRPINDTDRRLEQWIASNLDWDDATTPAQPVDSG